MLNFEEYIVSLYKRKITPQDIAKMFDVSEKDIRATLALHKEYRDYNKLNPEIYNRIVELYLEGKTQEYIAETVCVGPHCIVKTLKNRGIKRRTTSEANRKYDRDCSYFDEIDSEERRIFLACCGQMVAMRHLTTQLQFRCNPPILI